MLHAELHGKLGQGRSELERLEDTLTSTVFGILLLGAGGRRVLGQWLNRSRDVVTGTVQTFVDHEASVNTETAGAWFWPRLDKAEPDVLLRLSDKAILVEAKYASAKSSVSDDAADDPTKTVSTDQLAREWRAIGPVQAVGYSQAIRECLDGAERHLVYLVSSRHVVRAREELRASYDILVSEGQSPSLLLLTWQDLHRVLNGLLETTQRHEWWWSSLMQLLERRELQAFLGFARLRGLRDFSVLKGWSAKWHQHDLARYRAEYQRIDWSCLRSVSGRVDVWRQAFSREPLGFFDNLQDVDWSVIARLAHTPFAEHNHLRFGSLS